MKRNNNGRPDDAINSQHSCSHCTSGRASMPRPSHLRCLQDLKLRIGVAAGRLQLVHQPRQQRCILRNILLGRKWGGIGFFVTGIVHWHF